MSSDFYLYNTLCKICWYKGKTELVFFSTLKEKWYLWCFEQWWVGIYTIFLDAYFFYVSIITQPWNPEVSAEFVFMFMSLIQKFCFLVWFSLKSSVCGKLQVILWSWASIIQWVIGHPSNSCTLTLRVLPISVPTRPLGPLLSCPIGLLNSRVS